MRIIKKEIELYTFAELSKKVQEKLLEKEGDYQTEEDWWEYTKEMWEERLEAIGFIDADISFSGFCSQGDGASFTSGVDVEKIAEHFFWCADSAKEARMWALVGRAEAYMDVVVHRTNHRYSHENTCSFESSENFQRYEGAISYNREILSIRERMDFVASGHYTKKETDFIKEALRLRMKTKTTNNLEEAWGEACDDIEQLRKVLCRRIYKDLETEYDFLRSDENVKQYLEDVEFTAEGERYDD